MFVSKVSSHQADYDLYFKPGQSFSLQSWSSPKQSAPEGTGKVGGVEKLAGVGKPGGVGKLGGVGWAGAGCVQVSLNWTPPPQGAEHSDHSPTSLNPSSTDNNNDKRIIVN